ncbi:hypothetical protein HYFRA_00000014 [Hymenoscyphus fraxineus]|uniref:F-box domain-containing protein n=1 Tax=Hymenoscyphus fraxineus TaxID=746836 RepID=A0A9N9PKZ0_9HELO|nr:hypothetical protein HYFRA_00000014 [Hymenoscyphus fraxineus]
MTNHPLPHRSPQRPAQDEPLSMPMIRVLVPHSPKAKSHLQDQPIFKLPFEVLHEIFALTILLLNESTIFQRNRELALFPNKKRPASPLWALCLVCRQFNRLATPLLYQTLSISSHPKSVTYSAETLLHETLRQNTTLSALCKKLYIEFSDTVCVANPVERLIGESLPLLNNVTYLNISGGITQSVQTYGVVKLAVKSMRQLQELHLKRGAVGLLLAPIFTIMNFPHLKTLTLSGIMTQPRNPSVWPSENSEGTANFTSLKLYDFGEGEDGLSSLMQWTTRIEHFTFLGYIGHPSATNWTLGSILNHLKPHSSSLKILEVGQFASLQNVNFSSFKKLETIKVISQNIEYTPEEAAAVFLTAPSLSSLTWHFATCLSHQDEWGPHPTSYFDSVDESQWDFKHPHPSWRYDFNLREAHWLKLFAEHMVAGKSLLRKIHIQLSPLKDGKKYSHELKKMMTEEYEECSLDELREIVGPNGLEIVYRRPYLHLRDWWVFDLDPTAAFGPHPLPELPRHGPKGRHFPSFYNEDC